MTTQRRLHPVPEHKPPVLIDPPSCPDTLSDEWITGWQACREVLYDECRIAYERGYQDAPSQRLDVVLLGVGACSGFVVGVLVALAAFA